MTQFRVNRFPRLPARVRPSSDRQIELLEVRRFFAADPAWLWAIDSGTDSAADNFSSALYKFNTSGGARTKIGETGVAAITDIAFNGKGQLFGVTATGFYSIDLTTALATFIGPIGVSGSVNALDFSRDGTLYAATQGGTSGQLLTINIATGAGTIVGDLGYVSQGDLAFDDDGTLFASLFDSNAGTSVDGSILATINLASGRATKIGKIGSASVFGLAFGPDDSLLASTGTLDAKSPKVVSIDKTTGAGTFLFSVAEPIINGFAAFQKAVAQGPGFALLDGTTLTITGTDSDDNVTTRVNGSTFTVTRNNLTSSPFALSAVTKIIVNLLDGNDSYSSDTQLDIKQTINGGNGNDLLRGGKQVDVMNGGDGDDRMDGRSRGDIFNGGPGSDVALYRQRRANEPVTVIIDEIANDGGSADLFRDNVLSSTEHIYGGLGNDHLTGSSKTNRLYGFEGDDTLVGLKGNDTLDGGAGANHLDGGFGNDTLFSRNSIVDIVDGGADTDSLVGDLIDNISNVENPNLA
ncbi:hypothetical protein BH09PLA1_BH09PLA1_05810 [soil metagenome]